MLSAGVGLKFSPVMLTAVPAGPLAGEKVAITGAWAIADVIPIDIKKRRHRVLFFISVMVKVMDRSMLIRFIPLRAK